MRILVTGVPHGGKTTFATQLGKVLDIPVYHTDAVIDLGWSESSAEVATWLDRPDPWVIEGVTVPRAIRKWLAASHEPEPFNRIDRFILFRHAKKPLTKTGQWQMAERVINLAEEYRQQFGDRWIEL